MELGNRQEEGKKGKGKRKKKKKKRGAETLDAAKACISMLQLKEHYMVCVVQAEKGGNEAWRTYELAARSARKEKRREKTLNRVNACSPMMRN